MSTGLNGSVSTISSPKSAAHSAASSTAQSPKRTVEALPPPTKHVEPMSLPSGHFMNKTSCFEKDAEGNETPAQYKDALEDPASAQEKRRRQKTGYKDSFDHDVKLDDDYCCKFKCQGGGIAGDLAALCCCPFSIVSWVTILCCKCPLAYASKTKKKVENLKNTRNRKSEPSEEGSSGLKSNSTSFRDSMSSQSSCQEFDRIAKPSAFEGHKAQHDFFFPSPEESEVHHSY